MLIPIIKKQKVLFLVIAFIATISTLMTTTFLSLNVTFKRDCVNYINEYQLPDVYLESEDTIKQEDVNDIYTIDGVDDVHLRWNQNVKISFNNKTIIANVRSYNDNSFPKFYYYEKAPRVTIPNFYPNILISKSLADINHLILRGQFEIDIEEFGIKQKFYTNGIVDSPETMRTEVSRGLLIDSHDFGYTFIHEDEINKHVPEKANKGNEVIIRTKENVNRQTVLDKAKNILTAKGYQFYDAYTKEMSTTYQFIYDNVFHYLDILVFVVPVVFAIVTLLLVFLFMYQIIKNMTREVGIMSALGISKAGIFGVMCSFALTISAIASVIGTALSLPSTMLIHQGIGRTYNMPIGNGGLDAVVVIVSVSLIVAIAILASIITIFAIRNVTPISAMNNQLDKKLKYSKLFKKIAPKISSRASIVISSLKANKIRALIATLTVASVFTLIFTSVSIITSSHYNVSQIEERLNFDARIYEYQKSTGFDFFAEIKKLPSVNQLEESYTLDTTIVFNNKSANISLTGLEKNHSFLKLPNHNNKECQIIDDGIVLEDVLANELGVKINDYVTVSNQRLKVNDISHLTVNKVQCVANDTLLKMPEISYKVAFVNVANKDQFTSEVTNVANCISIFSSNIIAQYAKDNSIVILLMNIVTIFSFIIGAIVIAALQLLIFNEEKRKYCIMEMIGFSNRNIMSFSASSSAIYLVLGVLIGLLPAIFLTRLIVRLASTSYATFFYFNYWWFYLAVIAIIIVLLIIINIFIAINLKHTSPAEFVNSRE